MLVFAPANGTSYTIQATNPASSLVYSIGDMGVNSDFVFTNSSQTLNNKTLDYAYSTGGVDMNAQVMGDTFYRFSLDNLGTLNFGPGNATQDITLS